MEKEEKKSFEENLSLLEIAVKQLEDGTLPLDDAINKYTQAMQLANVCSLDLKNATEQVNKILLENNELADFNVSE